MRAKTASRTSTQRVGRPAAGAIPLYLRAFAALHHSPRLLRVEPLAKTLGVSSEGVRNALYAMEDRGHAFSITDGGGGGMGRYPKAYGLTTLGEAAFLRIRADYLEVLGLEDL